MWEIHNSDVLETAPLGFCSHSRKKTLRPYRLITVGIRVFAQKLSPLGLINEQRHQVFPVCLFHYIQVDFNTSPQRSEELLFRHRLK
jgi:hypothetical protein